MRLSLSIIGANVIATLILIQPVVAAQHAATLPGRNVHPESVTSTADGMLYVGSFAEGGIMRVDPRAGEVRPWIEPGAFGSRSILGVLADERSGTLWACSNDLSTVGVAGPGATEGSYLKGFDLKTGAGRVSIRLPGAKAFCNDIAIGPDNAAYVTDSQAPHVLRLKPGSKEFEVFVEDESAFQPPSGSGGAGLDGIAFDKNGTLYVNKFTEAALFRIDVTDGKASKVTRLKTSKPLVLADGLRPTPTAHKFLMIEGQGRLDQVTISGDEANISVLKDRLDAPTGVALVADTAWVSEGQLPALFAKKAPNLPFQIVPVPYSTH